MKVKIILVVLLACVSCKEKPKEEKLQRDIKKFLENRVWVEERGLDTTYFGMPKYYSSDGVSYSWLPEQEKEWEMRDERMDLYLLGHSPFDKSYVSEEWFKSKYYKISGDTLIEQDKHSGFLRMNKIKILKDTVIGILDYYKIQISGLMSPYSPDGKMYYIPEEQRGCRCLISLKNQEKP